MILTVDLETTVNGGQKGTSPEAHYANNKVLLYGWKVNNCDVETSDIGDPLYQIIEDELEQGLPITMVGHNLKFDLKHLMRERPDIPWSMIDMHCTMYAEYRGTGHRERFIKLERLCHKHGIVFKKSLDLGALLKAGIKMEDIPISDLEEYLVDDVENTYLVYLGQDRMGYNDVWQWHLTALAHMELLGLPIDVPKAQKELAKLVILQGQLEMDLFKWVDQRLEWSDGLPLVPDDLKFSAPRCVSYLMTGEPAAGLTKKVRRNIVWKAGQGPLLTPTQVKNEWGKRVPTNLGYPLAKDTLANLSRIGNVPLAGYIGDLLEYRRVSKLIGTYYGPFLAEAAIADGTIHPKMNMATTGTGRLSSSAPNGQNMPVEARNLCKSLFGHLREIDFKQLEVVALAHLSKDKQLTADILAGEDIHFNTGRSVMGWKVPADMNDKDRKLVKNVNFGLIYGGGPKGLALQTGQPEALIKKLIAAFYARYPGVSVWQKCFYKRVTSNLKPAGFDGGEQVYDSLVECPTSGRKFYFKEGIAPIWVRQQTGRKFSFKPTETKNYPVQGFAGGDIVMMALALLYEKLTDVDDTEIRMTVHDSILVDTAMTEAELRSIMYKVCNAIETNLHLPFVLQFDIKSGTNWQ